MYTPSGYLGEDTRENFDIPFNGWYWFETEIEALQQLTRNDSPTESALKDWWGSLSSGDKSLIYCYASDALLAWERMEYEVMFSLIGSNNAPQLANLRDQISNLLTK